MSVLRALKLTLLGLIDPRLKTTFIDLEIEDFDKAAIKLTRQKRQIRRELRAIEKAPRTRKVEVVEETTVETPTRKVRSTKKRTTKRTTKKDTVEDEETTLATTKLTKGMTRDQLMKVIAKHTAPREEAQPQRPPPPTFDDDAPRPSALRNLRNFVLPDQPSIDEEEERKVVSFLRPKRRRAA